MVSSTKPLPAKRKNNPRQFLIYLGSSTSEKPRDYELICEQKGLPIHFRDVRELVDAFHSSKEETGRYKGNGLDKLKEVEASLMEMLQGSDDILHRKCEEYGLDYDPAHVLRASEDGGLGFAKNIWDAMDKEGIPKNILHRIQDNKDNKGGGPGVETASVLSAVFGGGNLMKRALAAARKLGFGPKSHVPVVEKTVLTLNPFHAEHSRPPIIAEGQATNYLYDPGELPEGTRISTLNYVSQKENRDRSCADLGGDYIAKHSARAQTIDDLAEKLGIGKQERRVPLLNSNAPQPFMLGLLPHSGHALEQHADMHKFLKKKNGMAANLAVHYPDHAHWPDHGHPPKAGALTTRQLLGGIETVIEGSDALMLLADHASASEEAARLERLWTLFSVEVAKQLIARDMHKSSLVFNHKGDWDEPIANHLALVNAGMTKDYNINISEQFEDLPSNIRIESNSYFDTLSAKNRNEPVSDEDARLAGLIWANKKRERYQRRHASEETEFEGGIAPGKDRFIVGIFCSAGNENARLTDNVRKLSFHLSKNGCGVIMGAGDRYTMGAAIEGVVMHRKELMEAGMCEEDARRIAYIAGISTGPILVSETEKGQFSQQLSYYKQTQNIYDRMADMLDHSNAVVVAPGGAGTLQEWVAPLMIKKIAPELFKDKPIIVYNPPLFSRKKEDAATYKIWDTALKTLLGSADYELLTAKPANNEARDRRNKRCHELGIYVESDTKDVEKRVESARKQWTRRIERERAYAAAEPELAQAVLH